MEKLFDLTDATDVELRNRFMEKYKEIKREDLLATTAVLESFTLGLRNKHAAWFWNIADTAVGADSPWMKEYRRMLWLRAYAPKMRWDEELKLVPFEMDCVVWHFDSQAAQWEEWGEDGVTQGHVAYARSQWWTWTSLRDHAKAAFGAAQATYRP